MYYGFSQIIFKLHRNIGWGNVLDEFENQPNWPQNSRNLNINRYGTQEARQRLHIYTLFGSISGTSMKIGHIGPLMAYSQPKPARTPKSLISVTETSVFHRSFSFTNCSTKN